MAIRQVPGAKPLNLAFSIPSDGATGVSPDIDELILAFDKNVVNDAVWENNRQQIRLFRGTTKVSIRVTRVPDTVDFDLRGRIFVSPVNPLRSFTNYRIVILPELTSRAGEELGETVTINFRTGARREE